MDARDTVNEQLGPSMPLQSPQAVAKDIMNPTSLWARGYAPVAPEILASPVLYRIYNCGPLGQPMNPAGKGQIVLLGSKFTRDNDGQYHLTELSAPYIIRTTEVLWKDVGDYRHEYVIESGQHIMEQTLCPGGDKTLDLTEWGVLATRHEEPTEAEIAASRIKLEKTFSRLVKDADKWWEQNTPSRPGVELGSRERITEVYKLAARFMNVTRPWLADVIRGTNCPGCGKPLAPDVAKCIECGAINNWKKAYQVGIITKTAYHEAVAEGLVPLDQVDQVEVPAESESVSQ